MIEEAFRQESGVELLTLYDPQEALDRLNNPANPLPALVLCSARFPNLTAVDFLRSMKSQKRLRAIPVLILGSYLLPHQVEELFVEQASSVIELPGRLVELENAVRLIAAYWLGIAGLPLKSNAFKKVV